MQTVRSIDQNPVRRRPQFASSREDSTASSQENDARPNESRNSHDNTARSSEPNTVKDSESFYSLALTQWKLNTNAHFTRVAGCITTQFYGHQFRGKPTLAFNARIDNAPRKERDFYTKADPEIDTWMSILGKPRSVFDLEAFVKKFPNIDADVAKLRKIVRCRVLHESCPVVITKMQLARQSEEARKRKSESEPGKLNIKHRASRRK